MTRKKGRPISPEVEKSLLANTVAIMQPNDNAKYRLAERGMFVRNKDELTKKCYMCESKGSIDNQLIPRWISKETMVCICSGCYERSVGWVKVDNVVKITDFNIGNTFIGLSNALKDAEWQATPNN